MTQAVKHDYDRIPYLVAFQNNSGVRDVYGGLAEIVVLESYLLKPKDNPSDTVLMYMHPIGGGAYLPMINALARAGHHVIYCNSRFRGTDSGLLMEKVIEDLGAAIKDAKERLGYQKVVLAGWSGGGSLSVLYQQQAQHATITSSPSGDGPDLTQLDLPAADGLMLLAAHISRHGTLTERIEPRPLPPRGERPQPRITAWVKDKLAELKAAGRPDAEFGFVVHGTMADPRWLDPAVDPNERVPGTCYLGDPEVVNMGPVGLARFCTLRSWLSQWSYDDANGDGVECGRDIAVPALVIGNLADDACTPSHTRRLFDAIGHPDKEMHEIHGATHYYAGPDQRDKLREAVSVVSDWLERHKFGGNRG